jgi:hypothetical protein
MKSGGYSLTLHPVSIIARIYGDKSYRKLCKDIAKQKHLGEELHSMFTEELLKMGEEKLGQYTEEEIKVYCVGIIYNIWHKRTRIKLQERSKTHDLFQYTSTLDVQIQYDTERTEQADPLEYFIKPEGIEYNYIEKVDAVKAQIQKDWDNPDVSKMYPARVFWYSYFDCKNPTEFSRKSKIPYVSIWGAINKFRNKLKKCNI